MIRDQVSGARDRKVYIEDISETSCCPNYFSLALMSAQKDFCLEAVSKTDP